MRTFGFKCTQCCFAHTDALVVLPHLGSRNGQPCSYFGAKYDPELLRTCAYAISMYVGIMLHEVSRMIHEDAAWHRCCGITMAELLKFIQQENNDFKVGISKKPNCTSSA